MNGQSLEEFDNLDLEFQNDERIGLEAMYQNEVIETSFGEKIVFEYIAQNTCQLNILVDENHILTCEFTIPHDYPSRSCPSILMVASWIDRSMNQILDELSKELKDMFQPGNVILFDWIQKLLDEDTLQDIRQGIRERLHKQTNRNIVTQKYQKYSYLQRLKECGFNVYKSETPTVEKDSKFIAHAAVGIRSLEEVNQFMEILLSDKKYETATHNMYAYRFEEENSELHENRNDDGENGAGDVLLKLLQQLNAKNILIVVTRWFGGTLLGPKRFRVISTNALQLLQTIPNYLI